MSRYELLERIGIGGMAEIFRGRAIAEGGFEKPVAIKKILPHLVQDQRFLVMLMQEASILASLRQRNIVQIYDVGLGEDGEYFLVMEFVDGGDLGAMADELEQSRSRLPLDLALHIGAEVCEALDHAHHATDTEGRPLRVIHRDVSPSNVLLSRSGEVKLTDFGIAKRDHDASTVTSIKGKFAYMSPEQSLARPLTPASDIYSLGIVLYEMIVGRRLYSGMNDFDALRMVRKGKYPRPTDVDPTISKQLEDIITTALAFEPEKRFATAGKLGATLRDYRYSQSTSTAEPAAEIARLVTNVFSGRDTRARTRERTVVRITTAVGFDPAGAGPGAGRGVSPVDQLFDGSDSTAGLGDVTVAYGQSRDDDATRLHQRMTGVARSEEIRGSEPLEIERTMSPRPVGVPARRDQTPTLRNLGPQLIYQEHEANYAERPSASVPAASPPGRLWPLVLLFVLVAGAAGVVWWRLRPEIHAPGSGVGGPPAGDSLPAPQMKSPVRRDR